MEHVPGSEPLDFYQRQPVYVRWAVYLAAIFGIMTYGVYGMGYDAQAFIYGGF